MTIIQKSVIREAWFDYAKEYGLTHIDNKESFNKLIHGDLNIHDEQKQKEVFLQLQKCLLQKKNFKETLKQCSKIEPICETDYNVREQLFLACLPVERGFM